MVLLALTSVVKLVLWCIWNYKYGLTLSLFTSVFPSTVFGKLLPSTVSGPHLQWNSCLVPKLDGKADLWIKSSKKGKKENNISLSQPNPKWAPEIWDFLAHLTGMRMRPCHFTKTTDSWNMLWHFPLGDVGALAYIAWIRLEPFKLELTAKSMSQPLIWGFSDCSLKLEENWFLLMWYSELSSVLTFSMDSGTFSILGLNAGDFALNYEYFQYSLWSLILTTSVDYLELLSQALIHDILHAKWKLDYMVSGFLSWRAWGLVRKFRH